MLAELPDAAAVIEMGANDTQIAAGKTLTVDATDLALVAVLTGTASETDGFLSITGGGLADTIIGATLPTPSLVVPV